MKTVTAELNSALAAIDDAGKVEPRCDDDETQAAAHEALVVMDRHLAGARDAVERALDLIQKTRCDVLARMDQF
jgi:hypothetical protein